MADDISRDDYQLYRLAQLATVHPTRSALKNKVPNRWTWAWPMNLTQDDRDFLTRLKVKVDA